MKTIVCSLIACALAVAPLPAPAQDAHGAIAFGQTAYGESVAYGFAWNYSAKGEAVDAALNACRAGGGTNCEELAWFQNGCGALAVDQYGGPQGKSAMSQEQAETRALQSCEAAGGVGCAVVGSQCAHSGGQAGTWSGSERVLPASEMQAGGQDAEPQTHATEARKETLTREQRINVQKGLGSLGFDAGPADGVFGPRTRAAIWDWQDSKGLHATGYLTMPEAEALAAVGSETGETRDMGMDKTAGQPPVGTANMQENTEEEKRVHIRKCHLGIDFIVSGNEDDWYDCHMTCDQIKREAENECSARDEESILESDRARNNRFSELRCNSLDSVFNKHCI
ncbi:MAG: DUF4189 domain-containing protein [Rhodospirillales bacterium]|nr:DUF4189 domain-containing protein [Rhodospirillales bacterium]